MDQTTIDGLPDGGAALGGQARRHAPLMVSVAADQATVRDAQRLRFEVFGEEMGVQLAAHDGLDVDEFDPCCDHIVVRDATLMRVVGTYRVLPPHQSRRLGRLYAESEFDLHRLDHLRPSMVELGRSCIHRDYRAGPTLLLLWAGLARYLKTYGYTHAIGCASTTLADGGGLAAHVRDEAQRHLAPSEYRVFPHRPFPHQRIVRPSRAELPPLIRGYLRAGARVCGEPAWNPHFATADFLMLLALESLNHRYARRFDNIAQAAAA